MNSDTHGPGPSRGAVIAIHAIFILAVLAMGGWLGSSNVPGAWYVSLEKPWFTPPNWLFAPVWTVLYVLIGIVGARKALYGGARELWLLQMAANFAWSPVFFGLQQPLAALPVITVMLLSTLAFIVVEWRHDRISAILFIPYAAWVGIATALNTSIVLMN